jgi:glycosyltransferase involved in cell wall biosynthesis
MTTQIPLRWIGATWDSSGYAAAARAYLQALIQHQPGINLSFTTVSFERQKTEHLEREILAAFENKNVPAKIQVIHLTPENYPQYLDGGHYNVGYTVWETDRLPDAWVPLINRLDEVWVPSAWNKQVFESSGVTKPVYVIPHVVAAPNPSQAAYLNLGVAEDTFLFYSIFQWIERKNPIALLKAYLTEFKPSENVCLAMKTYRLNTSAQEQQIIRSDVSRVKDALRFGAYPPIKFFGELMPSSMMLSFHQRGDCFVLPQRGEGFGIPLAEAMSFGKPAITTNYGGVLQFMNESNSYLVDHTLTPCFGMFFPNYFGYMNWAEPDVHGLKKKMRYVFEHQEEAKKIGAAARAQILSTLSPMNVSNIIFERLQTISEG